MERRTELSLAEWAVLALVDEVPRHGYEVAAELAPDRPLGHIWTVRRPAVYRALERLSALGHVEARRTEPGDAAPPRTIYGATRRGRRQLRRWLREPVPHLRDVRSALLLKLLLAERLGVPTAPLVDAQRRRFAPLVEERTTPASGADPVARWRHHVAGAVAAFLDELAGDGAPADRSWTADRP